MGLFGSFPLFPFFGASRGGGGGETLGKISEQAGQGKEGKREREKGKEPRGGWKTKSIFSGETMGNQGKEELAFSDASFRFPCLEFVLGVFLVEGIPVRPDVVNTDRGSEKSLGLPPPRSV